MRTLVLTCLLLTSLSAFAQDSLIQMEQSTTTASLRGIHAAGPGVAWASGTNGTVLRTEDAGFVWQGCAVPPGAEKLDFRGVWAWDAMTAIVMSSGPGDQSRLYKTTDGCVTWKLLLTNMDKDGFWDAILFSDEKSGYLLGDPVRGYFVIRPTRDGGEHWGHLMHSPFALAGTGAFAASNSSLVLTAAGRLMVAAGGNGLPSSEARIYYRNDTRDWGYSAVPMAGANASSGVFSLAFRNLSAGIAVGGDYQKPSEIAGTSAFTNDAGKHWTAATTPPHGYRSSVAWDADEKSWITAGPNGTDYSRDDGKTWLPLENGNWNAISLPYLVGPGGRIGKLVSLPEGRGPAEQSPGPAGQNTHSGTTVPHTGAKTR